MKFILLLLALLPLSAWAHQLSLGNYLKMQEALSKDDFKSALESHKVICEKELTHYKDTYKDCSKDLKNIDQLRESFKSLSALYIANGEKKELKDLIVAECSMANAKWIQKKGALRNPYYGKSMLECGQQI